MEKLASGYGLIEGPVWAQGRGLIYSDVINGGAYLLAADGSISTAIEHRRGMGGMVLHESGGLVVSGRNIAYKPPEGDTQVLLAGDPEGGILGFNDITTDAAGRIYAGSLAFRPVGADDEPLPGELFCLDTDGSSRVVGGDVMLTNGMGFSPDGKLLYHSESLRHVVRVYDVAADGSLGAQRSFAEVKPGVPDGLALAQDGSVWVAVAHGSRVDVFEPDGSKRLEIALEIPMVTSLCFGGDDLRDLYIVTGTEGTGRDDAGSVFRMPVDVPGLPVAPARVKVVP